MHKIGKEEQACAKVEEMLKLWGLDLKLGQNVWDLYLKVADGKEKMIMQRRCVCPNQGAEEHYRKFIEAM